MGKPIRGGRRRPLRDQGAAARPALWRDRLRQGIRAASAARCGQEAEGRRIELEPCELPLADQRIAGVVLDSDDKPVANANIFGYGEGQPAHERQDRCQRAILLQRRFAPGRSNSKPTHSNGGFGNATAEGGDTNITIQLGASGTVTASEPSIQDHRHGHRPGRQARAQGPGEPLSFLFASREADGQRRPLHADIRPQPVRVRWERATPIVVARDLTRNLAAAVDLEEGATNASVRLEPALTLAGRITDLNGKALTNAQAQALVPYRADGFQPGLSGPCRRRRPI